MNTVRDKGKKQEIVSVGKDGLPSPEDIEKLAKIVAAETRVKEKSGSAAFKSQERVMQSMRDFYTTVAERNKRAGYKERTFTDEKALELAEDCDNYMRFCTENGIIPTWNLLAVWLDCDMGTLYAEEMVSSKCSRILKKIRNRIFTILEQSTLQREGNPAAGIFFLKSLWGLSDQQPLDINVHTDAPRQITGAEAKTVIDLLPDEVHEK